jgi:hypothetical protein
MVRKSTLLANVALAVLLSTQCLANQANDPAPEQPAVLDSVSGLQLILAGDATVHVGIGMGKPIYAWLLAEMVKLLNL